MSELGKRNEVVPLHSRVDAKSAINSMVWQNAGRSGIDQWNFIMSPVAASQDGSDEYTKKWCPELSKLTYQKPLRKHWELGSSAHVVCTHAEV